MLLDIILVILLVLAVIKGYQRGLIVAFFSVIAFIIGLAAAIKLSAVVAGYIGKTVKVSQQWLPILSFALVFLLVVLLVNLGARFLRKAIHISMLGWVDRIGGILLYAILYVFIFSVILFYAEQVQLIKPRTKEVSVTYKYVQPLGPKVIDGFGKLVPFFKDMFTDLKNFFGGVSKEIPAAN